jgi:hypothetical protein
MGSTIIDWYLPRANHPNFELKIDPSIFNMPEEAVLNVLCHACQNLFAADPGLSTRILNKENLLYIAHHRICLLYTSVGTGCHLCALILAEISGLYSAITQEWESHKNHDDQIWVRFCLDKVKDLNLELHAGEPHNEERFGRGILHLRKANSMYLPCLPRSNLQADQRL